MTSPPAVSVVERSVVTATAAIVAGVAVAFSLPLGEGADRIVSESALAVLGLLALVGFVRAARRTSGLDRGAWVVLLCVPFVVAAGTPIQGDFPSAPAGEPLPAGLRFGFVAAVVSTLVLLVLARRVMARVEWFTFALDAVWLAVAALGVLWPFVGHPVLHTGADRASVAAVVVQGGAMCVVAGIVGALVMHTEPRLRPLSVGLGVGFIGGELFHVAFHLGWIDGALVIGSGVDWILTLATGALAVTAWLGPRAAARIEASEPTGRANLVATWLPLGILVISVSTHMSELDDHWLIVLGGAVVVLMSRLTFTILHNAELASVLEEQATHDQLTGLPNRSSLGTAFDELGDDLQAMMIIDLDRFKAVNDQLGMAVGDQLLRDVAGRLTNVLPVDWTIARVGGDEFTAITAHGYEPDELRVVAGTVVDALTPSFTVLGREAWIGASIGAAAVGGDIDRTDLGAVADLALRHAKQAGRGEVVIGDAGLRRRAGDAAELASEIAAALDRGEFACVYQPKVDLTTGDLIGVEALVRWHHPGRGLLLPGEFLDVAEATGLIARIDAEVLSSAVAQLAEWTELAPDRALRLSTNMSAWQLARHDVAEDVERALDRAGGRVDPDLVTIELTETLLIDDPLVVRRRLERLRSTGVHVSVDDFGAGFTSVAHLREFPISEVKIDRALTAELEEDLPAGRSVAGAVIALATALGLAVVAEGVESVGQARRLRGLGCRDAQGFLFSPPVPPEQITAWLGVAHPFAGLVGQEWSTTRSRAESAP